MMKFILPILIIITLIGAVSCSKTNKKSNVLPQNALELLAGESGKTWKIAYRYNNGTRMNMSGCFLSYRITYYPDMTMKDNNGEYKDCGSSLSGNWKITKNKVENSYIKITSDQLPEIMKVDKNYKFLKILKLTKDTLRLQFRHKQFSSKSTFIDTYVPIGL
ncbi:lipocalin-like domain-containing protein [Aquimarina sediminis]|uniref:lipocalin family protein n=1 Tax=Aquimarina sediminis TaxID=2070536 RepID=UPI0013E8CD1C|nr:lipocalin family protein [Aquimarina sediminis]